MVRQTIETTAQGPWGLPRRTLLGPGPSEVDPRVLAALGLPLVGHLDPAFVRLMDEMQRLLRHVFQTQNHLTLAMPGTGSAGMETALVNLVEPGDRVLIGVNGIFGARMADVARRAGAEVTTIERAYGQVFDPDEIRDAVKRVAPQVVGIVHAETSTGACQPLPEIARVVHEHDALILVDAVTSLGGITLDVDAWDLDAVYSGTQKCLSAPPGLSPATFGPRAVRRIESRTRPVQSWYLDLTMIARYWGEDRFYHHTAPISMTYALAEALRIVTEEGLDARIARHQSHHRALEAGLSAAGLALIPDASCRLPQLNAVWVPEGVDEAAIRRRLLTEWNIEIGGGLGPLKGRAWRIGLMGYSARRDNVLLVLSALETCLRDGGLDLPRGAAVEAASAAYARDAGD